jgi:sugar lactone lactonase YvrE
LNPVLFIIPLLLVISIPTAFAQTDIPITEDAYYISDSELEQSNQIYINNTQMGNEEIIFFDNPVVGIMVNDKIKEPIINKDHNLVNNIDGTVTWTGHMPYIKNGSGNFVPYILTENEENNLVQVDVNGGKFIFDKNGGSVSVYKNGEILINNDRYTVRTAQLNSDDWSNLDVNDSSISTTIEESGNYITISFIKENNEGLFKTEYVIYGGYLKTTAYFTNYIYDNNKFAFTQTLHLPDSIISINEQEIDLNDYVGQSFPRQVLEQNEDLILQIKDLYYSSGLGFENLWSVNISSPTKVSLDYANVEQTQTEIGETVELDPTLGWASNQQSGYARSQIPYTGYTGIDCSPTGITANGYIQLATPTYAITSTSTYAINMCYRSGMDYDISSIPDSATIMDVDLSIDVTGGTGGRDVELTPMSNSLESYRLTTDYLGFYNDVGSGTPYVASTGIVGIGNGTVLNDNIVDLGTTADSNLQSSLTNGAGRSGADVFTVGVKLINEDRNGHIGTYFNSWAIFDAIQLSVTYKAPPDAPTPHPVQNNSNYDVEIMWENPSPNGSKISVFNVYRDGTNIGTTSTPTTPSVTPFLINTVVVNSPAYTNAVATDFDGNTYVADSVNHLIKKYDKNANYLYTIGTSSTTASCAVGEVGSPIGMATDSTGDLWVNESVCHRVQKFDGFSGTSLYQIGGGASGSAQGNSNYEFMYNGDVTIDSSDNVYVLDSGNMRLQKYNNAGTYLWGLSLPSGTGNYQSSGLHGIGIDKTNSDEIYIADRYNSRVLHYTNAGVFIDQLGTTGSQGGSNSQFSYPSDVSVDPSGNVYVADALNARVQIFDDAGNYIQTITIPSVPATPYPSDVDIDPSYNIHIGLYGHDGAQVYSQIPLTSNFTDTSPPVNTSPSYTLTATNAIGTSSQGTAGVIQTFSVPNTPTNITDQGANVPLIIDWTASTINDVTYDKHWTWDITNYFSMDINGNTVTKTSGTGWNSYIRTIETINSNAGGEFAWKLPTATANQYEMGGFSQGGYTVGSTHTDLTYGILFINSGQVQLWESGTYLGNFTITGFNASTSVFKVVMDNSGTVTYWHNNILIHTSSTTASGNYYGHSALHFQNNTLELITPYSWTTPSPDVSGYKIERDDGSGFNVIVADTGNTNVQYSDSSATGNIIYKISGINGIGTGTGGTHSATGGVPPDAPTGITTSINNPNPSPLDITVNWSSPSNVGTGTLTGFEIYRDGSLITTTGLVTTYTDTVPNSGTFVYSMKSISSHGTSVLSATSSITTPTVPSSDSSTTLAINNPNPSPFDITVSLVAPSSDGGSSITGYNLHSSPDDITYTQVATGVNTAQTITVANAGTWYFKSQAINNVGTAGLGTAVSITTPTVPLADASVTLTIPDPNGFPFNATATFVAPSSDGGSNVTGYNLFYSDDNVTYSQIATASNSVISQTLTGAGTHYFKVESINNVGTSTLGTAVSITTATVPPAPASSSSVITDSNVAPYNVVLTWTTPSSTGGSDLTGYNVYRQTGSGSFSLITTTTALTFNDTLPTAVNQAYTYKIHALNNVGESTLFTTTTITTADVPSAPVLTYGTAGTTSFSWTVPNSDATITGYEIYRDTILLTTVTTTSHTDFTTINFGQSYAYDVKAVSLLGSSVLSNTIIIAPETEITGMIAQGVTGTGAVIDWDEPAYYQGQITSYNVYYITPAQSGNPTTSAGTTSNTYSNFAPTLSYNSSYTFGVTINSPLGNSGFSNLVNVTTSIDGSIVTYDPTTGGMEWFDIDSVNDQTVNVIEFTRETQVINATATDTLQVGYPSWWDDMTCDVDYKFAQKTEQYVEGTDMTAVVNSGNADQQVIGFSFQNVDNEVIEVECAPQQSTQDDGVSGKYVLTQNNIVTGLPNIPLVTQITNFSTGSYGTDGDFGALDIVGIFVIMISMVGFNRVSPIVGVLISASLIFVMAFFGIITIPTVVIGVIGLVIFLAWGITRNR